MPLIQLPDVLLELAELLSFEDATCLAIVSVSTLRTLEAANRFLSSSACKGIELFGWRPFKGALFQQVQECVQPHVLVDVCWCENRETETSSLTVPMPISLDTSGRFFVRFWMSAGQAWNGCPSVGVVDADRVRTEVLQDPSKLCDDWSRPREPSEGFGICCNPYTGKIHTSHSSKLPQSVVGDSMEQGVSAPRSWTAEVIGWQSGEGATQGERRSSIEIGMLISNGTLEFIRRGPNGWESSGVVWEQLPAKILCCAFLFDFVGQAIVAMEEVRVSKLPSYAETQCTRCGKLSSWTAWPPA